jgi:hypothetical protein
MKKIVFALLFFLPSFGAHAQEVSQEAVSKMIAPEIIAHILEQGVPALSLQRILNVMEGSWGQSQMQSVYRCHDFKEDSIKPCSKSERYPFQTLIELRPFRYAISIDYSLPSTEKRLYFIDFSTGDVEKQLVAHGIGSGDGLYATEFSNVMDSRMTSLGMFLIQGSYRGSHGETMRLYGLESTNNEAYNRDIVLHGAWYAEADFMKKKNPKTDKPYDRLGLSYGCPAVPRPVMKKYLGLFLKEGGGFLDSYHPNFVASPLPQ